MFYEFSPHVHGAMLLPLPTDSIPPRCQQLDTVPLLVDTALGWFAVLGNQQNRAISDYSPKLGQYVHTTNA